MITTVSDKNVLDELIVKWRSYHADTECEEETAKEMAFRDCADELEAVKDRMRAAFFGVFVGAGELWFPYGLDPGEDESELEEPVEEYWQQFMDALSSEPSK